MSQKYLNAFSVPITTLTSVLLVSVPLRVSAEQIYFSFDNDVIIGADGDYSSGFVVGWQSSMEQDFSNSGSFFQLQSALMFPQ